VRKEDEYFSEIPEVKISGEMLKLAEHIVETKADEFNPAEFTDTYETALVEMLKQKQAGKVVSKSMPKAAAAQTGNIIDLLKRSMEIEEKKGKKANAPSLVPDIPKSKKKARA
jgi:DNA end-binding protein Ku